MKINTALIMCAGFGKRLYPITQKTPKPLLKIKNLSLLDRCIKLIVELKIKKILINSFHLRDKLRDFVNKHNYDLEIRVIDDGPNILNTGGGILNLMNQSDDQDFLIFNPDTIWDKKYKEEIEQMTDLYFKKRLKSMLMLVSNLLSFDERLKGDFGFEKNLINNNKKDYIYTGCQILNKSILDNVELVNFPIIKIWLDLINQKKLYGFESKLKFYHVTDLNLFKKLQDL